MILVNKKVSVRENIKKKMVVTLLI